MRCIDCAESATHRGRCEAHHQAYENRPAVRARRKRQAAIARWNSAAARLRKLIRSAGWTRCARCGALVLASAADVDHVQPLALGGEDTDENVQTLCRGCHVAKTAEDFPRLVPPC
jgi:5-methylcytosine-specific restriction protein A